MKIAVKGLIGYERAARLLEENEEVKKRLPNFFIEQFKSHVYTLEKTDYYHTKKFVEINEGGLYRSLWQLCELYSEETGKKKGCEIYFEKIPILQEVIEIMEIASEDPYESSSYGACVAYGENFEEGYHVIGKFTESKDRVIIHGENRRFLTPPSRQEKDLNQSK